MSAERRAFVIVLDACGVGALPDAAEYGDAGTNTLGHLAEQAGGLNLPQLQKLGLGSIIPLVGVPPADEPAVHGRLAAIGPGKDSTVGHWALMGLAAAKPLPTYPHGFPPEVIAMVEQVSGRPVICNLPYNGIDVINDFAEEQLATGALIVYTSADSVLQIAAHVEYIPLAELYRVCEAVRAEMTGEHAVGRVIARPYTGAAGEWTRTVDRKDLALQPPGRSYAERIHDAGVPVHSVGKAGSLLAGVGIDEQHPGATNPLALAQTTRLIAELGPAFVFVNLVETDQIYGHRHDVPGFAAALAEIDASVGEWVAQLRPGDLLVLTADHGVDVTAPHTDHTREYVPLLALFEGHDGCRHDGPMADVGASALKWLTGAEEPALPGTPFYSRTCMPELPEVETIRRQLAPHLEGLTLEHVEIEDYRWTQPDPPEVIAAALTGATVERVGRSGKYLIWEFTDGRQLLIHLRMTGALLFDPPIDPPHTHVRFELSGGHRLLYVDPRRFGTGHLLGDASARDAYLAKRLGPEPMTPAFTPEYLRRAARGRTGPVKSFILDQKQIAGVGNIYADEALFRAKVHPQRPAGRLTGAQWTALHGAIEQALQAGIDAKGASIDDFRHVDGARGSFQDVFLIHTRAGEPCFECGREITKLYVGGRGTYICTHCQAPPRARQSRQKA